MPPSPVSFAPRVRIFSLPYGGRQPTPRPPLVGHGMGGVRSGWVKAVRLDVGMGGKASRAAVGHGWARRLGAAVGHGWARRGAARHR